MTRTNKKPILTINFNNKKAIDIYTKEAYAWLMNRVVFYDKLAQPIYKWETQPGTNLPVIPDILKEAIKYPIWK